MTISNLRVEGLFRELIDEINSLKYQITLNVFLSKYKKKKKNTNREFAPVYFNFATKTVINTKCILDKSSQ